MHMAQLIPLPLTVSLHKIQIGFGFIFLVPTHLGSPGQNPETAVKKLVVVVVVVSGGDRHIFELICKLLLYSLLLPYFTDSHFLAGYLPFCALLLLLGQKYVWL